MTSGLRPKPLRHENGLWRRSRITMPPRSGYVTYPVQGVALRIVYRLQSSRERISSYREICSRFRFGHPPSLKPSRELMSTPCLPMQSLPKPARQENSNSSTPSTLTTPLNETTIDPDSELAHALQPLLEQEALLETFVQEATAKRKFEDAHILRENLKEIRGEIDRVVANAEREQARGKGKART
jgi:hypothetical protein